MGFSIHWVLWVFVLSGYSGVFFLMVFWYPEKTIVSVKMKTRVSGELKQKS
jgi:hypothetical protein